MRSLGEVAEAEYAVHLTGQSAVYDVTGSCHCCLQRVSTCGKWQKKMQSLRIRLMFLFPYGSISGCNVTHLIPVAAIDLDMKRRVVLLRQIAEDLGADNPKF